MEFFKVVQRNLSRASAEKRTTSFRTCGLAEISTRYPANMKQECQPLDCNVNIRFQPLTFTLGTARSQTS